MALVKRSWLTTAVTVRGNRAAYDLSFCKQREGDPGHRNGRQPGGDQRRPALTARCRSELGGLDGATLDFLNRCGKPAVNFQHPKRLTMAGLCNIVRQSTSAPRFLVQAGCSRRASMQKLGFRFEPVVD